MLYRLRKLIFRAKSFVSTWKWYLTNKFSQILNNQNTLFVIVLSLIFLFLLGLYLLLSITL